MRISPSLSTTLEKIAERCVNVYLSPPNVRVEKKEVGGELVFAWPAEVALHSNVLDAGSFTTMAAEVRALVRGAALGTLWFGFKNNEFIIWGHLKRPEYLDQDS